MGLELMETLFNHGPVTEISRKLARLATKNLILFLALVKIKLTADFPNERW